MGKGCGGNCSCSSKKVLNIIKEDTIELSITKIKRKVKEVKRHLLLTSALTKSVKDMLDDIEKDLTKHGSSK